MTINLNQLLTLQDIFNGCDEDWLCDHITVKRGPHREITIVVDKTNRQDIYELFGDEMP